MAIDQARKKTIMKKFGRTASDTGSCEVQIALLTARINELTEHFKSHVKDHHSRYGLIMMVEKRKTLLSYLERENPERYQALIKELDLRK